MNWPEEPTPQSDPEPQLPTPEAEYSPAAQLFPEPDPDEPILYTLWTRPAPISQPRVPHLGHLAILIGVLLAGWLCSMAVLGLALYFRLFFKTLHVNNYSDAVKDVHYLLAGMGLFYLFAFLIGLFLFPRIWDKSLLGGLHWRGHTAIEQRFNLVFAAFACIGLAIVNMILMPGPKNTPIERLFQNPTGAWLMFVFGVTFAPFFEEVAFRGFLLPALCTAFDWIGEKYHHRQAPALDSAGHPLWSLPAQTLAAICTSVPFALMHGEQTAYALGPFLLLVSVSLVLCWTRLKTRSLAASTMVHATYNFLLFLMMAISTDGFRHFDKM